MRVLLVNPQFPDSYWGFKHALKLEGRRSAYPPLGLLTVSALLDPSWERRLVDMEVQDLRASDIAWADLVFVTGMMVQRKSMRDIVNRCKAQNKRVVIGGPYVTTRSSDFADADHIFLGEAENTLPQFVSDVRAGQARRVYEAGERPSLGITPVPDFYLADLRRYSAVGIQFSRGCPFNCEFCDIIEVYGRVPRTKTNVQVIAELDALNRLNWRGSVFIVDDNFIGNKKIVRKLLPDLIEWQRRHDYPFSFFTEASVNLADDDALLADMREAGFHRVFLGIETPVEESLIETQKTQNTKRSLLESVAKLQSYGLEVMAGFIVGFDNDPENIFQLQIDFIRDSAIPLAMVGMLTPLPATQLWRRLEKEGRLISDGTGSNMDGLNFVPVMAPNRLTEGYRSIMETIYESREYYARALECLRRLPATGRPEPSSFTIVSGAVTLGRILLTLGVLEPERGEFWRYLYRAFTQHRSRFVQAVRLAAMGYHFRKLKVARHAPTAAISDAATGEIVLDTRG